MATLSILVEAAKLVEYDGDIYNKTRKKLMLEEEMKHTPYPVVHYSKKTMAYSPKQQNKFNRVGSRETHNILEKNRRADMKNYFQVLKSNLPKLRDMVKASNVSILTDAVKHIKELTDADRSYQVEKAVLRQCQATLEERIRLLKEDIRRQHFCAQLFVQVQEEKKRVQGSTSSSTSTSSSSSSPAMTSKNIQADANDVSVEGGNFVMTDVKTEGMSESRYSALMSSVETQANEVDIRMNAELSSLSGKVHGEEKVEKTEEAEELLKDQPPTPPDMMSVMTQANEQDIRAEVREATTTTASVQHPAYTRSCLSDLRNDFSQNGQSGLYRPPSKMTMTSLGKIGTEVGNSILACNGLMHENSSLSVQCRVVTPTPQHHRNELGKSAVSVNRRKRKLDQGYDDSDSESELKIVCDDE